MTKFKVKLRQTHIATGLSYYAVSKHTGVAANTVARYVKYDEVIVDKIEPPLIKIAEFYGFGWDRLQDFVEIIEESIAPEETKVPVAEDKASVDIPDLSINAIAAYFGVTADRIVEIIKDSPNPGESKTPLTLHLETVA